MVKKRLNSVRKYVEATDEEFRDINRAVAITGSTSFKNFVMKITKVVLKNEHLFKKNYEYYQNKEIQIITKTLEKELYKGQSYD